MKHSWKITILLLSMFLAAQFVGILVISLYAPINHQVALENGTIVNESQYNYPYGLNPPSDVTPQGSAFSIILAIISAAVLMLLLMKFKVSSLLRYWFFFVIALALAITLNSFIIKLPYSSIIAITIGLFLSYLKVFRRDIIVHNLTEILVYPGIAAIISPLLNVSGAIFLLIAISIYDMYAVWHAGFMQKMAKYQIEHVKIFSGFFIPYVPKSELAKIKGKKTKKVKASVAILGGGDVVFPIILSGVVLVNFGLAAAMLVPIGATLALAGLFYMSQKGKFYPAMPFISLGCFAALGVIYLLRIF